MSMCTLRWTTLGTRYVAMPINQCSVAHVAQMTHSIDSFITDSANSATALNSGHKSTVNALNVYVDRYVTPSACKSNLLK